MPHNAPSHPPRDPGFIAVLGLIGLVVVWLLLMPWVGVVAQTTMRRFHLQGESFVAFAIQFPIPSMYSFANTAEVTEIPPGMMDPMFDELGETLGGRFVNHFPARRITFSDARYEYLRSGQDRWFEIRSSYRGQKLISKFHLQPRDEGGFAMVRQVDP